MSSSSHLHSIPIRPLAAVCCSLSLALSMPALLCAESIPFDSAGAYAIEHNLDLAAARFRIDEARGRLLQSGRLRNPELEAEGAANVRGREFEIGVGFTQRFPVTARLSLEKAVSAAELAAAEAEVAEAERQTAAEAQLAAIRLKSLEESLALNERQIAASRELAEASRRLAERGEASSLEADQFDLELQQLSADRFDLESSVAAARGELRPLLGLGPERSFEITGKLSAPGDTAAAAAGLDLGDRPDYRVSLHHEEASRQAAELARAERYEDIGAGVFATVAREEDAPEGLENEGFIGVRVSIPLPWWNKNEGAIAEADAAAQRRRKETEALASRIRSEAATAREEMNTAARAYAEISGTLLPQATQLEERFRANYQQGLTSLTDVLRAREKRLMLESRRIETLRSYHLARARFLAAHGGPVSSTAK